MARPKIEIDAEQVEKLAGLHCTIEEIANFFGCHRDTISDRFSEEITKGKAGGRMSLRRAQWKAALGGNVTMQIWLGKQYLAQSDDEGDGKDDDKPPGPAMTPDQLVALVTAARGERK